MDIVLKVSIIAIGTAILISLIRIYQPEYTVYILTAASIILVTLIFTELKTSFAPLLYIYEELSFCRSYFPIILKVLIIAYITEFASSICSDCGEKSLSTKIDLAGRAAILIAALPVFVSLLDLLKGII